VLHGLIILEADPMEYESDVRQLRRYMKGYYGMAMFNEFPMAVMDLSKAEHMSDLELVELAQKNGVDLRKNMI
jgi:predicted xylose isomerase-like sugar epimerase